ncbi:MAG TPA: hypothetical protein PKN23_13895, partial [Candidatus Hydrogenedentes bacterium]|nr:hypothetical protein [Candidatus Hydrogenedentota bacterium]
MVGKPLTRRALLAGTGVAALAAAQETGAPPQPAPVRAPGAAKTPENTGSQRLSLTQLQAWEKLGYGMFLCFGMSTFVQN